MADPRKQGQDKQDKRTQLGQHQDKQAQQKNTEKQNERAAALVREATDGTRTGEKRNEDPEGKSK